MTSTTSTKRPAKGANDAALTRTLTDAEFLTAVGNTDWAALGASVTSGLPTDALDALRKLSRLSCSREERVATLRDDLSTASKGAREALLAERRAFASLWLGMPARSVKGPNLSALYAAVSSAFVGADGVTVRDAESFRLTVTAGVVQLTSGEVLPQRHGVKQSDAYAAWRRAQTALAGAEAAAKRAADTAAKAAAKAGAEAVRQAEREAAAKGEDVVKAREAAAKRAEADAKAAAKAAARDAREAAAKAAKGQGQALVTAERDRAAAAEAAKRTAPVARTNVDALIRSLTATLATAERNGWSDAATRDVLVGALRAAADGASRIPVTPVSKGAAAQSA